MKKNIIITQERHSQLRKLAKKHQMSMKAFVEDSIEYFHRTGLDPRDLLSAGQSKSLKSIQKQTNFVVGFIKRQEKELLIPMMEIMLAEKGKAEQGKQSSASCPVCQAAWAPLVSGPSAACTSCGFSLQCRIGNVQLTLSLIHI